MQCSSGVTAQYLINCKYIYLQIFLLILPQSIQSALVSRILPAATTCSLISAKVSYRKIDGRANTNPDELWLQICNKRDECDQAIKWIPGVAFFFSAVAAVESRVKKNPTNEGTEEEGGDNNNNAKQVMYWPALSYWIVVQSQNGTHVSTVPVHSVLLETGMEVTAKALPDCNQRHYVPTREWKSKLIN